MRTKTYKILTNFHKFINDIIITCIRPIISFLFFIYFYKQKKKIENKKQKKKFLEDTLVFQNKITKGKKAAKNRPNLLLGCVELMWTIFLMLNLN